jgi:hypothetical protein
LYSERLLSVTLSVFDFWDIFYFIKGFFSMVTDFSTETILSAELENSESDKELETAYFFHLFDSSFKLSKSVSSINFRMSIGIQKIL